MIWADMTAKVVIKRGRAGNTPCAEEVLPTGWEAIRAPPGRGKRGIIIRLLRPSGISLSLGEELKKYSLFNTLKILKMQDINKQVLAPEEKEGKAKTRQEARKLCAVILAIFKMPFMHRLNRQEHLQNTETTESSGEDETCRSFGIGVLYPLPSGFSYAPPRPDGT